MDQFTEWLQAELDKRSWLANDLAKRAGLGSGSLSQIMNGYRKPGPDLCRSIAAAMHLPEELVFRQAGLLSPKTENCVADHAKGLIDLLNKHQLDYVVEVIQWRLSLQDDDDPPTSEDSDEENQKARLLKIVEQMSPEQRENEIKNLRSRAKLLTQTDQEQKRTQ